MSGDKRPVGRPYAGKETLHCLVSKETKDKLKQLSVKCELSIGEIVENLIKNHIESKRQS